MDVDNIRRDHYRDTRICRECVDEPDLRDFIAAADGEPGCSFCDEDDAPTCEFVDFMDHVRECVTAEYDWAANWLPWDSSEGGWQWDPVWDTYDLLFDELEIGFSREGAEELLNAMIDLLEQTDWCERDPFGGSRLEVSRLGWTRFCEVLTHSTRFFLDRWAPPPSDRDPGSRDLQSPANMLTEIGCRLLLMEVFQTLPADSTVYRARYCARDQFLRTPEDLGPPPRERAVVANRMSPPGIVMFYGALDPETALLETATAPGHFAVGQFRVLRDLRLLDLTALPDVPGFFVSIPDSQPWGRGDAQFFAELVRDLTRPVARDNRIHVDYIPTQVVTEYFRMAFHHEHETEQLDGIVYPSARNCGRPAVVLFADRKAVAGIEPELPGRSGTPWLELVSAEHFEGTESFRFSPREMPFS